MNTYEHENSSKDPLKKKTVQKVHYFEFFQPRHKSITFIIELNLGLPTRCALTPIHLTAIEFMFQITR